MVFHMRQHDKLNNPPSSEHTEEVVSNPPGETVVPSPSNNKLSKGGKRMKPVKEGNKKMKMTAKEPEEIVVAPSPPLLIQEEETSIHVDGKNQKTNSNQLFYYVTSYMLIVNETEMKSLM